MDAPPVYHWEGQWLQIPILCLIMITWIVCIHWPIWTKYLLPWFDQNLVKLLSICHPMRITHLDSNPAYRQTYSDFRGKCSFIICESLFHHTFPHSVLNRLVHFSLLFLSALFLTDLWNACRSHGWNIPFSVVPPAHSPHPAFQVPFFPVPASHNQFEYCLSLPKSAFLLTFCSLKILRIT